MCNPDGTLPPPPPALTRYMDPPTALAGHAEDAAKRVKDVCDVKIGALPQNRFSNQTLH